MGVHVRRNAEQIRWEGGRDAAVGMSRRHQIMTVAAEGGFEVGRVIVSRVRFEEQVRTHTRAMGKRGEEAENGDQREAVTSLPHQRRNIAERRSPTLERPRGSRPEPKRDLKCLCLVESTS